MGFRSRIGKTTSDIGDNMRKIFVNMIALISTTVLMLGSVGHAQDLPSGYITTIAGDTTNGYNGDYRSATGALLSLPRGIALTNAEDAILFADSENHRIRKVDLKSGNIFTIAGNGSSDFRGDGNLAIDSSLNSPTGIAVDKLGNIYIADSGNNRIRKVDTGGYISTIAGSSQAGNDGDRGLATQATLIFPTDVAVDIDGTVYIADLGSNRIRKVNGGTGLITTIAGNGERIFTGNEGIATETAMNPAGIALDGKGGLIIADMRNHRVRRINLNTGTIETIVGIGRKPKREDDIGDGRLAQEALLNRPTRVTVTPNGDIYICDSENHRIRKVDSKTEMITSIGGDGVSGYSGDNKPARDARLWVPYGIAVDRRSNIYIADYLNHRVRRINQRRATAIRHIPLQLNPISLLSALMRYSIEFGIGVHLPEEQNLGRVFSNDQDSKILFEPAPLVEFALERKTDVRKLGNISLSFILSWPKSLPTPTSFGGHKGVLTALLVRNSRPFPLSFMDRDTSIDVGVGFWFFKFSRARLGEAIDLNPALRLGLKTEIGKILHGTLSIEGAYLHLKGPSYHIPSVLMNMTYNRNLIAN